jgi:hypothetical protein
MNIPKKLKIAGYTYEIKIGDLIKTEGSTKPAYTHSRWQKIVIAKDQHKEEIESSLIHEILEAIDYHYSLKMDHDKLMTLETALYQVLTDNKLLK